MLTVPCTRWIDNWKILSPHKIRCNFFSTLACTHDRAHDWYLRVCIDCFESQQFTFTDDRPRSNAIQVHILPSLISIDWMLKRCLIHHQSGNSHIQSNESGATVYATCNTSATKLTLDCVWLRSRTISFRHFPISCVAQVRNWKWRFLQKKMFEAKNVEVSKMKETRHEISVRRETLTMRILYITNTTSNEIRQSFKYWWTKIISLFWGSLLTAITVLSIAYET